ncbi:glycosyl hydrolases family 31-domain-containing protein [Gymnopilus junonius]|uniref:Glycosyl hydrolases family 31-domain-containing protein n=1 Tax=Gymnopilus junonius TaxID=109634 RepID=A0A9P5NZB5_GYMJU|nr:glycosyl hydrolases family 31-domain-containing protein [Gymnopilus junonius]
MIGQSIQANLKGHPLMRAMFIEFPDDRTTHYKSGGPNLLVAPVFVPLGEESEYYVPAGKWTSFWDPAKTVEGPRWVREHVAIDEIPVLVRPGSALALGPEGTGRADYDYTRGLEVRAYGLEVDGPAVVVDVPVGKGTGLAGKIRVRKGQNMEVGVEADEGIEVVNSVCF